MASSSSSSSFSLGLEESVPPLIASLVASAERLPDLMELRSPEPVLATNRRPTLSNYVIPAVRFNAGTRNVAVFPLHREAIGNVWETESQLAQWNFQVLPKVWAQAIPTFRGHIDYPIEFLQLFISTLRSGHYMDNSAISTSTWDDACRLPTDQMVVQSICSRCSVMRSFAARTLLTASSVFPKWNCSHFGLECNVDEQHPIFSIAPDQWLMGIRDSSQSSTPKPTDAPPSFPIDVLAIPNASGVSESLHATKTTASPQHFAISTPPADDHAQGFPSSSSMIRTSMLSSSLLTWEQVPPARRTGELANSAALKSGALRRPTPSHYMMGDPLIHMHQSDPSREVVEEYAQIKASSLWRTMRRDFDKWASGRKAAQFEAKGSPNEVTNWDHLMNMYFLDNDISNVIVQARLASHTFAGQALNWWHAHTQLVPELVVSYEQLLEWIRTELVPLADPASSALAWRQLRFLGEVEDYLKQLDQLSTHFPISQAHLLTLATEPLGKEVVSFAQKANHLYGKDGMPYVRLRQFIQSHLQQLTPSQRKFLADNPPQAMGYGKSSQKEKKIPSAPFRPNVANRNRPPYHAQANVVEVEKPLAKPSPPQRRIGKGANPCWVCGSDKHMWYVCEKKKKGTCACCGSMAHITRDCAQRYFPSASAFTGKAQNVARQPAPEPRRSANKLRNTKSKKEKALLTDSESSDNAASRGKRSTRAPKKKASAPPTSSPSSSEDEAASSSSSDTSARQRRSHRRATCAVQSASDSVYMCVEKAATLDQSSSIVASASAPAVASKAVLDWPNVWGELSSQHPIGTMLQLAPISAPPRSSLLYYHVEVNKLPAVAMFDTGASQSFITYDLVDQLQASLIPLKESLTTVDFGGQKSTIAHSVQLSLRLTSIAREWTFYVSKTAPAPIVLGLDLVLEWPLFLNPHDKCLYVPLSSSAASNKNSVTRAACMFRSSVIDTSTQVKVEFVTSPQELSDKPHQSDFDVVPELTFNPETYTVEYLYRNSVTASGFAEQEELAHFKDGLPSDFRAVVDEFATLFQPPDSDPPSRSVKHYICVPPDVVPAARKAYPLPQHKLQAMREQMRELIDKGWVEPSASPWASPILFVPKDGGKKHRMCIDFRDLNALTKKDRFPLPRIDLLLHRSAKAKIFSKIDLASGFHQIEVFPKHRELTAFILPETIDGQSLWEWKVMPFGLVNAPSTFQRAMSVALQGCEGFAVVYIDDILIFSDNREQHLQHLRCVFTALQGQSYHVRLAKCSFLASEVPFLGHILTPEGIKAAEKRYEHIQSFPTPFSTPKQVRSFLGMVMWYRTFIPHVSTLAAPLFPLTSVKKGFKWTPEAEQSVSALKYAMTCTPVLSRYDHDLETRVTTDASTVGIGAVLEQLHDTVWKPLAFWSRKLLDAETRYSATDLEWLAVVEAVSRVWRHLLEDIPFTVRSDHAALARKLSKSAHDPLISPRQARWIERLMPFSITFEYIPGSQNVVPDALSRYPALSTNACVTLVAPHLVGLVSRIALAAQQDSDYMALVGRLQDKSARAPDSTAQPGEADSSPSVATSPNEDQPDDSKLANPEDEGDNYYLQDGIIFTSEGQILLPKEDELRTLVISEAHDSPLGGHFGQAKTLEKVRRLWKWRGLSQDVKDYVASCPLCQHMKHSTVKPRGLLKPILAERPWQIVTLDLVGKFAPAENTSNSHCLVIVDKFSKFVILEAVPETLTAAQTAEIFLRRVVSVFGVPSVVISDRGTQFSARLWKQLLEKIGSVAALASSHHPQTDGQSERAIQTFLRLLRSYTYEMNDQ